MKTALLMISCLTACSTGLLHPFSSRIDREEVSNSVYRMSEEITVDLEPYCKEQKNPALCLAVTGGTHKFAWTGTAWVVGNARGRTFMMTAGHLCDSGFYTYTTEDLGLDANGDLAIVTHEYKLPIVRSDYGMHAADGTVFTGGTVLRDDDVNDLCELTVPGDLGKAIPIAGEDPKYGQTCYYTGAPDGLWGGGAALTFELKFSGRGDVFDQGRDGLVFTGLGKGGASGSPMICDGQAVGVLVTGVRNFDGMFVGVPEDVMNDFHRKAHHKQED